MSQAERAVTVWRHRIAIACTAVCVDVCASMRAHACACTRVCVRACVHERMCVCDVFAIYDIKYLTQADNDKN